MIPLLIGYGLAVAAVSTLVARRLGGLDDYLTGGRGLGVVQGVGLLGGIFLAGTAVGVVGQGYELGWPGAGLDVALALGFAVLMFTLLPRLKASRHASIGALIRDHYGWATGTLAALVTGGSWLVLLAAFMVSAGRALSGLAGWSPALSIALTAVFLLVYAMPGGMRAVVATNLAQLVVLAVLLVVVAVVAFGREPSIEADLGAGVPLGYLAALVLLSAPTTVVAPDVVLGVASVNNLRSARRTLTLVVALLVAGGLFLSVLGGRAAGLVSVSHPENALPALMRLALPPPLGLFGLLMLFGATLAGAVSELLVCTFILNEEARARRLTWPGRGPLTAVRLQMGVVTAIATLLALANPEVVDTVVTAFRIFVPAIVPQSVVALLNVPIRPPLAIASMIMGPAASLGVATIAPETELTVLDPVLWGTLVASALLVAGRLGAPRRTPTTDAPGFSWIRG